MPDLQSGVIEARNRRSTKSITIRIDRMANSNKLYQCVLRITNPQLHYAGLQIQRDKEVG